MNQSNASNDRMPLKTVLERIFLTFFFAIILREVKARLFT